MAETTVNFVLGKLADPALKEVLFLSGVHKQVEKVKRELIRIQAFLKDSDCKQIRDEVQRNWVKEVRDVAYQIEDVVDTAFLLGDSPQANSCFTRKNNVLKKIFRKLKNLPELHKLGVEIDQILARIKEIDESRVRYGISNLGEGSSEPLSMLPIRQPVFPDFDDPDVVGLDKDTDNIVERLLDESTKRRSVVSIVGTGGLGKTTLARKAYNRSNVKCHFNNRVWVTVSKEFEPIDLLKKIIGQFGSIDPSGHEKDVQYFVSKLNECIKGKQYLLVLDDVWTNQLWSYLKEALPDEKNGSRVLITTRLLEVAKEADSGTEPYKLKFLDDESSIKLLLKKALPNHNTNKDYPNDLVGLAKEFAKKCGGLPLALLVLGGLLSKKSGYNAWDIKLQTMSWGVEGRTCTEVLSTSYEDLKLALKSCFMYFAMFPEDYNIDAGALVRMWVAEGFIPEEENRKLEDTAESFLEELAQRCMIQVSARRGYNDSIVECRIHDLLRDFAIQKAKEDNFLAVYSTEYDLTSCCSARRVAAHDIEWGTESWKVLDKMVASENLRSLVCSGLTPDCSKKRLLKVLDAMVVNFRWLQGLTQLRYIKISQLPYQDKYFERFLCSMKFLQTLDLRGVDHDALPDCIWLVKSLRHVMLGSPTSGPSSGADLRNLQTLTFVRSRKSWATGSGTPNLSNLRELEIDIDEGLPWEVVFTLLDSLKQLACLILRSSEYADTFRVPDSSDFAFGPRLQRLYLVLSSCHEIISLGINMFSNNLSDLRLIGLQLDQDPMPILERLQNLKKLWISITKYHKKQMIFSGKGFVQLVNLTLVSIENLEELEIDEGAMPVLTKLYIYNCPQLRVPLGLQHLTSLKSLDWEFSHDNLASAKADEIRNLCKHVPTIVFNGI